MSDILLTTTWLMGLIIAGVAGMRLIFQAMLIALRLVGGRGVGSH